MSRPDKLQQWAAAHAIELEQAEAELQAQISALDKALDPLYKRMNALKHRAVWLQRARQKLRELANACEAADPEEILF